MKTTPLRILLAAMIVLALSGFGSDASRITNVLEQCAKISHRAAIYKGNPGAMADFISTEFQKIDVTQCPPEFREAYQAHVFAWQQAAPALGNNTVGTAFIEGVAAGVTNDPGYIGQANQQAAYAGQQINSTYYVLTQIAAHYGARIPRSAAGE